MGVGDPRVIELRSFDLTKLTKVDVIEQFFKIEFFQLNASAVGTNNSAHFAW